MRLLQKIQLWFAPKPPASEQQREYEEMDKILDAHSEEILKLVNADLCRGVDSRKGAEGMTGEQVIRAVIIKQKEQYSYKELAFIIQDSATIGAFCRVPPGSRLSKSTLQRNIKKLRPETLEAINRIIVGYAREEGIEKGRKVRTDCTVVESNIHDPKDSWLLWDCVRTLTALLVIACENFPTITFKDHTRTAKRRAYRIENAGSKKDREKPYRELLKTTEKVQGYAKQAVETLSIAAVAGNPVAGTLRAKFDHFIELTGKVIDQTKRRVIDGEKVPANEKIVSIFESHTDIIVKDRRETLFGHKICITGGASGIVIDCRILDGNPADSTLTVEAMKRVEKIMGSAPRQAAFDGAFGSKLNLETLKKQGIKDVVFSKGKNFSVEDMAQSAWVYRNLRNFRAGIEAVISFLKRSFGLSRCTWRSLSSFKSYVWSSVVSANLLTLARHAIRNE